jgi:hypothetical protein
MTKQELEAKVNELELTLNAVELNAKCIKDDLIEANEKLANINKPVITRQTASDMQDAIQYILENFDFTNTEDYDYDLSINYDNRIELEHIEFNNVDEIAEQISIEIENLFNIEEDNE